MTVIQITNQRNGIQSTKYGVEIEAQKIEYDYNNELQTELASPKATDAQSSPSEFYIIDLQKRKRAYTITGVIDKWSTFVDGTDTSGTANKLTDSEATGAATFTGNVVVGCIVRNTTDNTIAYVTAIDSGTVLSLSADIMDINEHYYINIPMEDVSVVRKRLDSMWDLGGVNNLRIGVGDGYKKADNSTNETETTSNVPCESHTGVILKMKIDETVNDHYGKVSNSPDYPSSTVEKTAKYGVIITFLGAASR